MCVCVSVFECVFVFVCLRGCRIGVYGLLGGLICVCVRGEGVSGCVYVRVYGGVVWIGGGFVCVCACAVVCAFVWGLWVRVSLRVCVDCWMGVRVSVFVFDFVCACLRGCCIGVFMDYWEGGFVCVCVVGSQCVSVCVGECLYGLSCLCVFLYVWVCVFACVWGVLVGLSLSHCLSICVYVDGWKDRCGLVRVCLCVGCMDACLALCFGVSVGEWMVLGVCLFVCVRESVCVCRRGVLSVWMVK